MSITLRCFVYVRKSTKVIHTHDLNTEKIMTITQVSPEGLGCQTREHVWRHGTTKKELVIPKVQRIWCDQIVLKYCNLNSGKLFKVVVDLFFVCFFSSGRRVPKLVPFDNV
jgi:hypothetical protein